MHFKHTTLNLGRVAVEGSERDERAKHECEPVEFPFKVKKRTKGPTHSERLWLLWDCSEVQSVRSTVLLQLKKR